MFEIKHNETECRQYMYMRDLSVQCLNKLQIVFLLSFRLPSCNKRPILNSYFEEAWQSQTLWRIGIEGTVKVLNAYKINYLRFFN